MSDALPNASPRLPPSQARSSASRSDAAIGATFAWANSCSNVSANWSGPSALDHRRPLSALSSGRWYHCGSSDDAVCGWTEAGGRPTDVTVRSYDALNRLTKVDYPSGTADTTTTYTPDGLVASVQRDDDVLQRYTYNRRRLLESERLSGFDAIDWTTRYAYDAHGSLSQMTYPDNHVVAFEPNALGQATKVGTYATGATYFPNGALKGFTYGNGHVHTLTLNERGLPDTSLDAMGGTIVLQDKYLYDENGNVAAIDDRIAGSTGDRAMTYDDLDRLLTVAANNPQGGYAVFEYDPLDNIRRLDQGARARRHEYAGYNRLTGVTDAAGTPIYSYGYDVRGNQSTRTGTYTDTYTFDAANRLTGSTVHSANGVATTSSYLYDGLGRRVREMTGGLGTISSYGHDGKLLYQFDEKTTPDEGHAYFYLAGSLVAKRTRVTGGSIYTTYQHTDALGSPVATTDQLGTMITRERMTAYGEPADGSWQRGPGYTGHVMDDKSKLVYMQQRYYDPTIGRFISPDPVATDLNTGDSFNRYWYANNNPVRFTDPDGRQAMDQWVMPGGISTSTDLTTYGQTQQTPGATRQEIAAGLETLADAVTTADFASPFIKKSFYAQVTLQLGTEALDVGAHVLDPSGERVRKFAFEQITKPMAFMGKVIPKGARRFAVLAATEMLTKGEAVVNTVKKAVNTFVVDAKKGKCDK